MSGPTRHTLHAHQSHHGWNNEFPPLLTIAPGEAVEFDIRDASGGQITERSGIEAGTGMDFGLVNPVTGPVAIDGAEPGDALKVTVLSLTPTTAVGAGWGWTANIPGFGLLADQFPQPALHLWTYRPDLPAPALFGPRGQGPPRPFTRPNRVAPAAPRLHTILPPRRGGGHI